MSGTQKKNILLFPFMAQGHIIPFLSLAHTLQNKNNYTITFVNTPKNINRLRNHLPQLSNIRLVEIPFDSTQNGLPPNTESTENIASPLMKHFIESSSSLKPAFRKLVSNLVTEENRGTSLFCIISDMFFAWSVDVAREFGICHAVFNAGGGYGMAGWHAALVELPHLKLELESGEFRLPGFPEGHRFKAKTLPPEILTLETCWQFALDTFEDWKKTDAMIFNTVEEIDRTGLNYFREQFPECSVYAVGPVFSPMASEARGGGEAEETRKSCMTWLDAKPESSVLYIAFGSQNSPSESQIIELAKALEASNVNFLWVLRPPPKTDFLFGENTKMDWLPKGFEERIRESGKGLLLRKWAPQMEILSHRSVGAFLTHCGWNSVIEALSNGVPMLSWPMAGDQTFNEDVLERGMGVCVGVGYAGNACEVKFDEMVKKIDLVMKDGKGELMRRKACEVMEIIQNATSDDEGSSVRSMNDFLNLVEEKQDWN